MGQVRLHLHEARGDRLPRVCLRCGRPADSVQTLDIAWFPPWVNWLMLLGFLPYLIVSPLLTKRATLNAPFCARHRYHWHMRQFAIVAAIVIWMLAAALALWWYPLLFLLVLLVLFPALVIVVACVHLSSVRPTDVTDTHLVIDGVCEEFVAALVRRDQALAELRSRDEETLDPPPSIVSSKAIQAERPHSPPSNAIEE